MARLEQRMAERQRFLDKLGMTDGGDSACPFPATRRILRRSYMTQLQILYLVSLLMDMSVAGVVFAIGRRAAELGASAAQLGWLGAVWIGVYAVVALVMGRYSDRVGRRKLAIIG